MSFAKDVLETVGPLFMDAGYCVDGSGNATPKMMVFSKRFDVDLGLYVFFRDNRAKGGNVTVNLWFAPIQMPDSSIDVLGVGINTVVLSVFEITDEVIERAARKAIQVGDRMGAFEDDVREELASPVAPNRRTKVFSQMLAVFSEIMPLAESAAAAATRELREEAKCVWLGKGDFEDLENSCEQLLSQIETKHDCVLELASLSRRKAAVLLAEMLAAHSI